MAWVRRWFIYGINVLTASLIRLRAPPESPAQHSWRDCYFQMHGNMERQQTESDKKRIRCTT